MRIRWAAALAASALCLSMAPAAAAAPAAAGAPVATITAVRAAHHPGYDRYVLQFDRTRAPAVTVASVTSLVGDASGLPVPVPGRAILRVVVSGAQAHDEAGMPSVPLDRAFALPNILATRGAGDFEGVVTLGIGLARRMPFHVHRLTSPGRVAIDVSTAFARTTRTVAFYDSTTGTRARVTRPVPDAYPATGLLDRLLAGPTPAELARGLVLHDSGATGVTSVRISDGIARVRLAGQCRSDGYRFTVADHVRHTLRPLASVRWVKVHDPSGTTRYPRGRRDSEPACLQVAASQCHYLVRDLHDWGHLYTGSFLVVHVEDNRVVGTAGAFSSEWTSVRGTIEGTQASLEIQDEGGTWRPWPQTWASGSFVGWTDVPLEQMRTYSGGGVPVVGQPCW